MTIAEFILARIAEDEAIATAFRDGHNYGNPYHGDGDGSDLAYDDRFDPARVLAECAALRRIVADFEALDRHVKAGTRPPEMKGDLPYEAGRMALVGAASALDSVLRALATIWATHPDYLPEEWA